VTDTVQVIENTTEEKRFAASSTKPCILTIRDGSGVHVGIDMLVPKLSPRSYKFSADNTHGKEHVLTDTYRFKPGKYFASASVTVSSHDSVNKAVNIAILLDGKEVGSLSGALGKNEDFAMHSVDIWLEVL